MAGRGMAGTGRREGSEGKKNGIAHPLVFALVRQPNLYTDAKTYIQTLNSSLFITCKMFKVYFILQKMLKTGLFVVN